MGARETGWGGVPAPPRLQSGPVGARGLAQRSKQTPDRSAQAKPNSSNKLMGGILIGHELFMSRVFQTPTGRVCNSSQSPQQSQSRKSTKSPATCVTRRPRLKQERAARTDVTHESHNGAGTRAATKSSAAQLWKRHGARGTAAVRRAGRGHLRIGARKYQWHGQAP